MVKASRARIAELEGTAVDEMARAEGTRDTLQRVRTRLTMIGEAVRDRALWI